MSTCLSLQLFDYSTARMDTFNLSTLLGSKFMDAYVGLIASQKLQTESYILSYLLKDRVYPGDLWELVGERSIEAMQEETLRSHQCICKINGDGGKAWACGCRAISCGREEETMSDGGIFVFTGYRNLGAIPNTTYWNSSQARDQDSFRNLEACGYAFTCEAWLMRNDVYLNRTGFYPPLESSPPLENSSPLEASPPSSLGQPSSAQEEPAYSNLDRIGPSLPLLSTWVTADVQEAFYEAFQTELDMQSKLMTKSPATRHSNANLRNHGLDLLILQAKMHRAQTEITLYTLALENTHAFDFSDHSSQTSSWGQSILRPVLSDELRYCDVDTDDDTDQSHNDFEVW
ncbi:hypothetical protein DEU56DRAFT_959161 [Suillus clintonianus]|uniref:uncharacterized protein n=1 Tax=Suillus clintonianus TaxID=1904413 RepID=UPI001B87E180|nr:uncharacterized protein DEU56DRAFT_959161 [Suillus clintonianus]KAG2126800.1 hypothetical protein DEU56DRAFT_959161 [Suillus clintonianus]